MAYPPPVGGREVSVPPCGGRAASPPAFARPSGATDERGRSPATAGKPWPPGPPLPPYRGWIPTEPSSPEESGYLRYVVAVRSRGRALRVGIFRGSDRFRLKGAAKGELEAVFEWFNRQLPIPPRDVFEGGAGVCWFRTDWNGFIRELWSAARRIEEAGYRVWQVYNRNPGRITYQDEFQAVAIPRWHARGWPYDE